MTQWLAFWALTGPQLLSLMGLWCVKEAKDKVCSQTLENEDEPEPEPELDGQFCVWW